MASINAESVAKEVIKKVSNGMLVNLEEISENHGYSHTSARAQKVKKTKTFQKTIASLKDRLKNEIDRIQIEMSNRDITDEKYIELAKVMDIYIKNSQLLGGKPTEIINDYSQMSDEELIRKARSGSGTSQEGIGEETS